MDDPFLLRQKNAAELLLIRHGDAIPGPDEIIPGGIYDNLPLSSIGREQAQSLAERLGGQHFDAIYSSPLKRCQQTAAPLSERLGLTPVIVPNIQEIRIGQIRPLPTDLDDLAVLTKALQERQFDIVRIAGETGNWDAIENSEPSKEFRQRVVTAIDDIACQTCRTARAGIRAWRRDQRLRRRRAGAGKGFFLSLRQHFHHAHTCRR